MKKMKKFCKNKKFLIAMASLMLCFNLCSKTMAMHHEKNKQNQTTSLISKKRNDNNINLSENDNERNDNIIDLEENDNEFTDKTGQDNTDLNNIGTDQNNTDFKNPDYDLLNESQENINDCLDDSIDSYFVNNNFKNSYINNPEEIFLLNRYSNEHLKKFNQSLYKADDKINKIFYPGYKKYDNNKENNENYENNSLKNSFTEIPNITKQSAKTDFINKKRENSDVKKEKSIKNALKSNQKSKKILKIKNKIFNNYENLEDDKINYPDYKKYDNNKENDENYENNSLKNSFTEISNITKQSAKTDFINKKRKRPDVKKEKSLKNALKSNQKLKKILKIKNKTFNNYENLNEKQLNKLLNLPKAGKITLLVKPQKSTNNKNLNPITITITKNMIKNLKEILIYTLEKASKIGKFNCNKPNICAEYKRFKESICRLLKNYVFQHGNVSNAYFKKFIEPLLDFKKRYSNNNNIINLNVEYFDKYLNLPIGKIKLPIKNSDGSSKTQDIEINENNIKQLQDIHIKALEESLQIGQFESDNTSKCLKYQYFKNRICYWLQKIFKYSDVYRTYFEYFIKPLLKFKEQQNDNNIIDISENFDEEHFNKLLNLPNLGTIKLLIKNSDGSSEMQNIEINENNIKPLKKIHIKALEKTLKFEPSEFNSLSKCLKYDFFKKNLFYRIKNVFIFSNIAHAYFKKFIEPLNKEQQNNNNIIDISENFDEEHFNKLLNLPNLGTIKLLIKNSDGSSEMQDIEINNENIKPLKIIHIYALKQILKNGPFESEKTNICLEYQYFKTNISTYLRNYIFKSDKIAREYFEQFIKPLIVFKEKKINKTLKLET